MPKLIYHDSDGIDKTVVLGSEPVLIGRATECQVQTQDAMVSRRHARIYWDGNYWIEDLGSSNGVYVGNDKVQKAPFRIGDTVTCGSLVLRLMPDTTPRPTGMMTGQQAPMRTGMTPPVGNPQFAATLPPPAVGGPPPAAGMGPPPQVPPRSGEVQIGPNAVLRGAVAAPAAPTGQQASMLMEELRQEKQRREQAEAAVLTAAERVKEAEAKVAELETLAKDAMLIKRKLDQAQADLRRLRGGKPEPVEETRDDGEASRLRARVAELEADLAAANARAQALSSSLASASSGASAAPVGDAAETARLKRQVEQLQAELRRARGGAPVEAPPPVQLQSAPARPSIDPEAADAAIALGDSLAELRSSLRAANDEAGLLTAPSESVAVVSDALKSAAEQLETARGHLRALGKLLGVS